MKETKATIETRNGKFVYFDKEGNELHDGDYIQFNNGWNDGKIQQVCLTNKGELGVDATNPSWIERGLAVPFEYGVYPLDTEDMAVIVKVKK